MNITDTEIEEGLNTAAKLIDAYGEKYWPVFKHLEAELERRQSRSRRLTKRLESVTK